MTFDRPLIEGRLLRRYQRFLADVELADGTVRTVHCPNPGAMLTCSSPGRPVLLSDSGNPRRKLRFTLEMIRMGRTWVGTNTLRPNRAVAGFVARGRIPELEGYRSLLREVGFGEGRRSRFDLWLGDHPGGRLDGFVEIKNTTYRLGDCSVFPDAATARGRKHLEDLQRVVAGGCRGVIFFFVGRADCRGVRPADTIDPAYGAALRRAVAAGVEPLAYRFRFTRRRVELVDRVPVEL